MAWLRGCGTDDIDEEDVIRFDHGERTFAIYRSDGGFFATGGICAHEEANLADGLVIDVDDEPRRCNLPERNLT